MTRGRPKGSSAARRKNAIPIRRRAMRRTLFAEEELNLLQKMEGFNQGEDVIQVLCGCTDKKFGDTVGTLKISSTGQFIITCDCPLEHTLQNKETAIDNTESTGPIRMTPKEFESHARDGVRRWKSNIWVMKDGHKVSLRKSGLLRFYKYAANETNWDHPKSSKFIHRDEFLRCCECMKERRFRLRTVEECKAFHDASTIMNWRCAYHDDEIDCDDEEERVGRKTYRGCPRAPACPGCTSCVCLGCSICRFKHCDCRTCVDYIQNVEP